MEERRLGGGELRRAHSFSALCHSLIEDNAVFVAVGGSFGWLLLPRLLLVWLVMQIMLWWDRRSYRVQPEVSG